VKEETVTASAQRILVPLDGSPLAELALAEAVALSKLPNTEVTLLQVVPPIEEVIGLSCLPTGEQASAGGCLAAWPTRSFAQRTQLSFWCARRVAHRPRKREEC